jgi:hypothetical protein
MLLASARHPACCFAVLQVQHIQEHFARIQLAPKRLLDNVQTSASGLESRLHDIATDTSFEVFARAGKVNQNAA